MKALTGESTSFGSKPSINSHMVLFGRAANCGAAALERLTAPARERISISPSVMSLPSQTNAMSRPLTAENSAVFMDAMCKAAHDLATSVARKFGVPCLGQPNFYFGGI